MEDIKITDEMIDYTKDLVLNKNFAHRGKSDGTTRQQFIGILAENYIRFILDLPLVTGEDGFDGGYDLVWNGMKATLCKQCSCYTDGLSSRSFYILFC